MSWTQTAQGPMYTDGYGRRYFNGRWYGPAGASTSGIITQPIAGGTQVYGSVGQTPAATLPAWVTPVGIAIVALLAGIGVAYAVTRQPKSREEITKELYGANPRDRSDPTRQVTRFGNARIHTFKYDNGWTYQIFIGDSHQFSQQSGYPSRAAALRAAKNISFETVGFSPPRKFRAKRPSERRRRRKRSRR